MGSILTRFGITERLLGPDAYAKATDGAPVPRTAIEKAVRKIAPKSCGIPLIRIGPDGDGGYLMPDDLGGIAACFSPGTNNYKGFEDRLARDYGIKSFMCDRSSDVEKFRTPLIDGMQFFEKKWLDVERSDDALDIDEWVRDSAPGDSDLILQMDIEGAEYRNLLHASAATLSRFRIVALEIHGLGLLSTAEFLNGVFDPVLDRLGNLFGCVHAHPNNCCGETDFGGDVVVPNVLELTFLRKDRFKATPLPLELPHRLDVVNVSNKPPLHLRGVLLENADPAASRLNARIRTARWSGDGNGGNVAKGKPATQSSLSRYSTAEGAGGAVNGIKTGRFGFHTEVEANPWWSVDLGRTHALDGILVYNRLDDCRDRIRTLRITISEDGRAWTAVYEHNNRPPFGGIEPVDGVPPLLVPLNGARARYVKLECTERTALHLDQVEVFGSAIP